MGVVAEGGIPLDISLARKAGRLCSPFPVGVPNLLRGGNGGAA